MGLYLSPWDVNSEYYVYKDKDGKKLVGADGQPLNGKTWDQVKQEDALDYNEYYDNQLKEILGNDNPAHCSCRSYLLRRPSKLL